MNHVVCGLVACREAASALVVVRRDSPFDYMLEPPYMHIRSHPVFPKIIPFGSRAATRFDQAVRLASQSAQRAIALIIPYWLDLGPVIFYSFEACTTLTRPRRRFNRLLPTQRIRRDRPRVLFNVIHTFSDTRLIGSTRCITSLCTSSSITR